MHNKSVPRYEHNILTICLSSTTNDIDITEHRTDTKLELSAFNTELQHNTHNNIEDQQESGTCKVKTNRYVAADMPYESAIQTLRAYHNIYGDLVIPRRYIVPSTAEFPKEWHEIQLSKAIYNMKWWTRHVKSRPERVCELNQLGFVWERMQPEWNLVLEALITYKSQNGHVKVPASFIVPSHGDERNAWPRATWGVPIGNCVQRIRTRSDFLRDDDTSYSRRKQLDGLGFLWDVSEHAFGKFFTALRIFSKQQNYQNVRSNDHEGLLRQVSARALRVPSTFVVPSGKMIGTERNPWPEDLWGYKLGQKVVAVRQKELYIKNKPMRRQALEKLGFQWNGNAALGWLETIHAAAIYSRMHHRNLDVPVKFKVPSPPNDWNIDEWPWPQNLWCLPLGQRLKDIRTKGAYLTNENTAASRKAQLNALGFVWQPKRGRKKRSLGSGVPPTEGTDR